MRKLFFILASVTIFVTACDSVSAGIPNMVDNTVEIKNIDKPEYNENILILVGEGGSAAKLFLLAAEKYQREHGGEIAEVNNGDEFIDAIRTFFEKNGYVQQLVYFGHGNDIALFVNQEPDVNAAVYANDPLMNSEYLAASIYELDRNIFTFASRVEFYGCNTARGYPVKISFAQKFANYFNTTVFASTGPTEFDYNENDPDEIFMAATYANNGFVTIKPEKSIHPFYKDLYVLESGALQLAELYDKGLRLSGVNDYLQPYRYVTYAEALQYCRLVAPMPEKCDIKGFNDEQSIRNLTALQMLIQAFEIKVKKTDPWWNSYIWEAKKINLLTEDFANKRWYTRLEMAELTMNFYNHFNALKI